MTMQTATLESGTGASFALPHRTSHLALIAVAFIGMAVASPSSFVMMMVLAALSAGLAAWSVVRIIRADREGLTSKPSMMERMAGAVLIASMIWLAHSTASAMLGAPSGMLQSVTFAAVMLAGFAIIAVLEIVGSALACYALKRFAATGSIGAEIAVMLNLQQKFATSLDGADQ